VRVHPAISSGRVALYYWACSTWPDPVITSVEIGRAVGVIPSHVRRDLSTLYGSTTGRRGVGYRVSDLLDLLGRSLDAPDVAVGAIAADASLRSERLWWVARKFPDVESS
jgi:NADH/NAD ratio-sensing transcriptional regulator Rex